MHKLKSRLVAVTVLALALGWANARVESRQAFPRPTGYVNDFAGVMSADAKRVITSIAEDVKIKTGAEMAFVTIATTGGRDIEEYSVDLFVEWGIGQKGKDNGVLVLVAFQDRQLWIKTGYGLEGAIPDAEASRIYRETLRPGFRAGQYDQALVTTAGALATLILAESGQSLAVSDTLAYRRMLIRSGDEMERDAAKMRMLTMVFGLLMPVFLVIILRILAGRRGLGGRRGGLFWMGGFGGSSGGFGGGFGGFGGGMAGGGGAGGGW